MKFTAKIMTDLFQFKLKHYEYKKVLIEYK